ncbi:MAG: queuosine precursor transporter [Treponema sp.]|nr:queuosine precursor transporter [Treponema sp.]
MAKKAPLQFRCLDLVIALSVAVLITSNIASSAKIIDLGFSVFGIHLAFDGGTLLFPLDYVIGDLLTEVYGFRIARRAIWIGFFTLAVSALLFFIIGVLPGEQTWEGYAGEEAYRAILGGMSSGGIIIASLSAYVIGNYSNSVIMSLMKVFMKGRILWMRTIGSSVVGELLDSLTFISIASLAGVFPWSLFVNLVFTNYILKLSIEIIVTPISYLVIGTLKKMEGLDVYDHGVSYTPF